MWKAFASGLIVGIIGSLYIFTKLRRPPSPVMVEVGGVIIVQSESDVDEENLENSTLFEDDFETMLWLMNYSTYLQTISDTAKWN